MLGTDSQHDTNHSGPGSRKAAPQILPHTWLKAWVGHITKLGGQEPLHQSTIFEDHGAPLSPSTGLEQSHQVPRSLQTDAASIAKAVCCKKKPNWWLPKLRQDLRVWDPVLPRQRWAVHTKDGTQRLDDCGLHE